MANAGAIKAGKAFVEIYADNTSLEKGLRAAGEQLKALGAVVTKYVSLPLGGVAAAAFASSEAATKAFKEAAAGIKGAFGRLGDQLASDLNLKDRLQGAVSAVDDLISGFKELPKTLRLVVEGAAGIAVALGPAIIAAGSLVALVGKLAPAWAAFNAALGAKGLGSLATALGFLGAGGAIIATAGAGLAAGYGASKVLSGPSAPQVEETRTGQMARDLANKAFGEGRSNLLVPTAAIPPSGGWQMTPGFEAALNRMAPSRQAASAAKATPGLPASADLESFLRQSSKLADSGLSESDLKVKADQAKQVFKATLGELGPVFNKFSDETWGTYFERLANGIRDGGKELKDWIADSQGKRLYGPMAEKFAEDQQLIRDSLALTEGTADDKLSAVEQELRAATDTWAKMRAASKEAAAQGLKDTTYLDAQRDKVIALRKEVEALRQAQIYFKAQDDIFQSHQTSYLQGGGVNLKEEQRQRLIAAYNQMSATPGFDRQSVLAQQLRKDIEALQTPMQYFIGQLQAIPPIWQQIGATLNNVFQDFTTGLGNATAQIVVFGAKASQAFSDIGKQILSSVIGAIIKMVAQTIIGAAVSAFVNAFASTAAIPIVGPALAPGVAAAAASGLLGGVAGVAANASAVAATVSAANQYEKGGISLSPQLAALSERGRPELHLTRPNIKKHFPELYNGRGGDLHLQVYMDSDPIVDTMVRKFPNKLRLYGVTV